MPQVGAAARGSDTARSFWFTRQQKERSIYFAALRNGDAENWFGSVVSEVPADFIVPVSNLDPSASGPAALELAVQGVTVGSAGGPNHQVAVSVNGTDVGTLVFNGQDHHVATLSVPRDVLREGDNTVTLVALGGPDDMSLFDTLRLSYWHTYRADADLVRVTADGPGNITIGGFAARPVRVIDITDPSAAVELVGREQTEGGGLTSVSVQVPGTGTRTLLAFSPATMAVPASVRANNPSAWHTGGHAIDYVAITHASFAAATRSLTDLRQRQGLASALVDVEDVYDEFNFGEKTPDAIKDFLLYAHATWRRAPRFLLLVGDATIDPRDYAGFGDADFVPTKSVPMNSVALETASDEWFADFDENGLPEMAVGRFPVRTPPQAVAVVAKTLAYDQEPAGPWAKQVTFVADRDDSTTGFKAASARLETRLPGGYSGHDLYRDLLGPEAVRAQLFSLVDQGQLLVNYMGHGSTQVWGSDGDLLANGDIATSWTASGGRLPVVIAMNCLNGFFQGVYDEESLAEALIRAPAGGAVAVWASSSLTPTATQQLVDDALFQLIFSGAYATLGESVAAAKQAVTNRDLRRSWIYFGDPALRLKSVPRTGAYGPGIGTPPPATPSPVTPGPDDTGDDAAAAAGADAQSGARLVDFDGDGRADVFLYSAATGAWTLRLSRGRLTSGRWAPGLRPFPSYLNGDRLGDVFLYDPDTGDWVQAIGDGRGGFTTHQGSWAPGWDVHVADLDGDGRDDMLLGDPQAGASFVCLTDTAGGFACRAGDNLPSGALYVADFTGDHRSDLFVYDATTGNWATGVNAGAGTFQFTTGTWSPGWTVSVGDLDGDGRSDLVLFHPTSGAWVIGPTAEPTALSLPPGRWAPGDQVHLIDLSGDGRGNLFRYDPVTGNWATALQVAPGRFEARAGGIWRPGASVAVGDLNGDRRDDLLLLDPSTGAWLSLLGQQTLGLVLGDTGLVEFPAAPIAAAPVSPPPMTVPATPVVTAPAAASVTAASVTTASVTVAAVGGAPAAGIAPSDLPLSAIAPASMTVAAAAVTSALVAPSFAAGDAAIRQPAEAWPGNPGVIAMPNCGAASAAPGCAPAPEPPTTEEPAPRASPDNADDTPPARPSAPDRADVRVTLETGQLVAGAPVTLDVVVANAGPGTASAVQLRLELPDTATITSAPAGCVRSIASERGPIAECALPDLEPGATTPVSITLQVSALARGTLRATARVASAEPDPKRANNTSTLARPILVRADLGVTVAPVPGPVTAGEPMTWTLTIHNAGPSAATLVRLDAVVPAGAALVSAPPACAVAKGVVRCPAGDLLPGESRTVSLVLRADGPTGRDLAGKVTVASAPRENRPEPVRQRRHVDDARGIDTAGAGRPERRRTVGDAVSPSMRVPAISIDRLTKTFPASRGAGGPLGFRPASRFHALAGVDLDVFEGEIVGLLGPNGAGKTTLLEILATLLLPDGGTARVGGHDVRRQASSVRTVVAYCAASVPALYPRLTGEENLAFFAALHNLPPDQARERAGRALDRVGINGAARQRVQCYSEGMKQRLALARALLTDASILLLDEPTRSLDPAAQTDFRRLLRTTLVEKLGKTVLLVTHSVEEARAVCDRVAILQDGALLHVGTPAEVWGDGRTAGCDSPGRDDRLAVNGR